MQIRVGASGRVNMVDRGNDRIQLRDVIISLGQIGLLVTRVRLLVTSVRGQNNVAQAMSEAQHLRLGLTARRVILSAARCCNGVTLSALVINVGRINGTMQVRGATRVLLWHNRCVLIDALSEYTVSDGITPRLLDQGSLLGQG